MNALITGFTGFVGKNLIRYLKDSDISYVPLSREELVSGVFSKIDQSDSIIHLAGKAHVMEKISDPDLYYEINFELTKKLFDAFISSDAKKFIFKVVLKYFDVVLLSISIFESRFPQEMSCTRASAKAGIKHTY